MITLFIDTCTEILNVALIKDGIILGSSTISSSEHNSELANKIMRSIQEEFKEKKNITIKFES